MPDREAVKEVLSHLSHGDREADPFALAVGIEDGQIIIHFGKVVEWIKLRPDQALALAETLRHMAARIKDGPSQ